MSGFHQCRSDRAGNFSLCAGAGGACGRADNVADDAGESGLIYTWATLGNPPAPVTFSANGTNASKNTTVTFVQSQPNSSARIMGSDVRTPCPISDLPHQIFTSPPEESSSQAFGEKGLEVAAKPEIL